MYFPNDAERTANAEVARPHLGGALARFACGNATRTKLFDSHMISLVQHLLWKIEHLKDLKQILWVPARDRHEVKAASFRSFFHNKT